MKKIEYRTIDKSSWGPGDWQDEPDKVQYKDHATGLPCLIVRNGAGALCGYVGVTSGHPWFQKGYDDVDASVHGGLTFAGPCQQHEGAEENGICHLVEEGEDDNVWWLGFDCAHCNDHMPAYGDILQKSALQLIGAIEMLADLGHMNVMGMYRNIDYVKSEIRSLAKQARDAVPMLDAS